jgi:hypothetical protein
VTLVFACFSICACDREGIAPSGSGPQLRGLTVTPSTAPADDATVVTVSAVVPAASPIALPQVVFNSTAGAFTASGTGTVVLAVSNDSSAIALLRAPARPTAAIVSASAGDTVLTTALSFTVAEPDSILVEPSTFTISASATPEVTITALLYRSVGFVSSGILVNFSAPIGTFGASVVSNDSGAVHVRYAPGAVSDTVADTITATVTHGDTVSTGRTVLTVAP